ncbi:MAG TPA: hypothetical protein VFM46_12360, partial [Pseudomonadales bacterium]|nr:hypothetical protein [Pseudomonadales bacterium]
DRDVNLVMHVGDIHSGSMPCTSAEILPAISTANPGWNQKIFYNFQQFNSPVVYTPGDNEWTDCHKSKEKSSGDPLKELASLRSLFFSKPGITLGEEKRVMSQAQFYDRNFPTDAQFVENVTWIQHQVVFTTVNMPGSNNDTVAWSGAFANPELQAKEVAERTAANIRWLQAAFKLAEKNHAPAVVIGLQADMWDPEAITGDGLDQYTTFVQTLADLATSFARPVLLLNGDSHVYGADKPLADPTSATGQIHHTQAVPNLTRITVQGSTNAPAEWLKLTINPRKSEIFSWQNIAYCSDPSGSCQ